MAELAPLVSTAEAADLLDVSVATINRWAAAGKLRPAQRLNGKTGANLFRREDVEQLRGEPAVSSDGSAA